MILPPDTITEIRRHGEGCVIVEGDPLATGTTFWARSSAKARPVCEMQVADSWAAGDNGRHEMLLRPVKPHFTLPPKPRIDPGFALSASQRTQLFDENYEPLRFDEEPTVQVGDIYVLSWSRARRIYDESGAVTDVPAEPLWWIRITSLPVRRAKGGWSVQYDVVDRREPLRLLRRVIDPTAPEPDVTSDASHAADRLEMPRTDWDETTLAAVAVGRAQHRHLREPRDREEETRSITHRIRRARAVARERGLDDSAEVQGIKDWLAALEGRLHAA